MDEERIEARLLALRHALAELYAEAHAAELLEWLMQQADTVEAEARGNPEAVTRAAHYRQELLALARHAQKQRRGAGGRPKP